MDPSPITLPNAPPSAAHDVASPGPTRAGPSPIGARRGPPSAAALRAFLVQSGYRIAFRCNGWTECLVRGGSERWWGQGLEEDDALEAVLAQMLPSALALDLVAAHLARTLAPPESDVEAGAPTAAGVTDEGPPPPPPARAPNGSVSADHLPPADETIAPEAGVATAVAKHDPQDSAVVANELPSDAPTAPTAGLPTEAPTPTSAPLGAVMRSAGGVAVAEAVGALHGLLEEIDGSLPTIAQLAAERQRLTLLTWICNARAVGETLPNASAVTELVGHVARRLSDVAKMLWPGSVRALQLAATPMDTADPRSAAPAPHSWARAEAVARKRLEEERARAAAHGLDEDGWADAAARTPAASDPSAVLDQVRVELDRQLGAPRESLHGANPEELSEETLETLLAAARALRWIRGSGVDALRWGASVGRLRRALTMLDARGARRLGEVLDARHRPPTPWSALVLRTGVLKVRANESPQPPAGDAEALRATLRTVSHDPHALLGWLIDAFDTFATPTLATMLASAKEQVVAAGVIAANHEDRRVRRRLRDLLQRLDESPPSQVRANDGSPAPIAPLGHDTSDDELSAGLGLEALLELVRPLTERRRALFVSNRHDAELEARLVELLRVELTTCDGTVRRVQAQCSRITQGSYDLVLSATGFQVHGVDTALARAAGAAHVHYVRVNRGRPLAVLQAIAREFGVLVAGNGAARTG